MKTFVLNCAQLHFREQAHLYLAQALEFPEYYGKNLDALFDCLTDLGECTIVLTGIEALFQPESYGKKVLDVLEEAAWANPNLTLEFQAAEASEETSE